MTPHRSILVVLAILWGAPAALAESPLTAAGLEKDAAIVERAYRTLHPALHRYRSSEEVDGAFARMRADLPRARTRQEAYLALSRFLAELQCGHTYANFYNQPRATQAVLFGKADKLPFTFDIIGTRMIVTKNASAETHLTAGDEVLAIDGHDAASVLAGITALVKGDGARPAPRLYRLQVSGLGEFEAFDVYFPMLYPPKNGAYRVRFLDAESGETREFEARTITRETRLGRLSDRYGRQAESVDDLWAFEIRERDIAYLRLGSFVTWKMKMDWRKFLNEAFSEIEEKGISKLIIDVRGNGGGDNEVLLLVLQKIASKALADESARELVRYVTVTDELRPYLSTWDNSFFDRTGKVEPAGDGFYTWAGTGQAQTEIPPQKDAFGGTVLLLIDAGNSSATFTMAQVLKNSGRAILIGQETGGNRKGITGGQIFFLNLPHSKLAADIPLIGTYPVSEQPDAGISPDVAVAPTVEDIRAGRDAVLEKALMVARDR